MLRIRLLYVFRELFEMTQLPKYWFWRTIRILSDKSFIALAATLSVLFLVKVRYECVWVLCFRRNRINRYTPQTRHEQRLSWYSLRPPMFFIINYFLILNNKTRCTASSLLFFCCSTSLKSDLFQSNNNVCILYVFIYIRVMTSNCR